jgi:hypothetical protein
VPVRKIKAKGMLRRRIKSALYIDFENVPLPADAIAGWLAWLEDGVFEPGHRRRRFLQKRVYWNSHAERNRDLFVAHGFVPILVGKFAGLKNGADIRMAMDVIEATYTRSEIDEYILLTGDSDFVPVLERLRLKSKRSAIVATEHRPNIHTTYQLNADVLIPSRRLAEAAQYRRPERTLLERLALRRASLTPLGHRLPRPQTPPAPAKPTLSTGRASPPAAARPSAGAPTPAIEAAARRVGKLLVQQPRNYVAQRRILAELERVPGFKRQGPTAFLGTGSYKTLMKELARLDPRITVIDQPGEGTGVVFIPSQPPAEAELAAPATPLADALAKTESLANGHDLVSAQVQGAVSPPAAPRPSRPATAEPAQRIATETETA